MSRLKHKRGRKSNYLKSLNSDYHKEVRRKALIRDKFQCRFEGCNARIRLERHHISYHILNKELEDDNLKWVVMLCEKHHQYVHNTLNHIWNPNNKFKKPII